jgi:hypothetical protein
MMLNPAVAAAERTAAARHLIAQAQADLVDLVTLSALDLCVLDLPGQPLFEERVAHAWTKLGDRQRRKVSEEVTASLLRRGLLVDDGPRPATGVPGNTYGLLPQLGLTLAARCRPAFIVVAAGEGPGLRPLNLFALGDQVEKVRAVVAEVPTAAPPDRGYGRAQAGKLGPLGWLYRYVLVSSTKAAEILAKWTITPPSVQGEAQPVRYLVSAYRPDLEQPAGYHLRVRGDGSRATVDGPGAGSGEYNLEGLHTMMLRLLTEVGR